MVEGDAREVPEAQGGVKRGARNLWYCGVQGDGSMYPGEDGPGDGHDTCHKRRAKETRAGRAGQAFIGG